LALDVAAAKAAHAALVAALEGPERELRRASAAVTKANRSVIALAAEPLVCEIFTVRLRLTLWSRRRDG